MMNIFKWPWAKAPPPEPLPKRSNFFSTDPAQYRGRRFDPWQYAQDNCIKIPEYQNKDKSDFALDDGNADINTKNAYTINRSGVSDQIITWFGSQAFIGWQLCAILAQNWLVDAACSIPAKDAIRKGYDIAFNDGDDADPEIIEKIRNLDKKYRLHKNLVEFGKFSNIFGIRILIFKIDSIDKDYYKKPFNIDNVKKGCYAGISQVDPYWCTPEFNSSLISDPASMGFYEPESWTISGVEYHKSHLFIHRPHEVADILKPAYLYGGVPLPQKIMERAYSAERCANEAPQLLLTKRLNTFKIDMDSMIANEVDITEKLEEQARYRDNYGSKIIGGDEEVGQLDTTLTDVDAVIMGQYQIVAMIAEIPASKLLKQPLKGLGATGEYEEADYHEKLEGIQTEIYGEIIERHHALLMKSTLEHEFPDIKDRRIEIIWRALDAMTALEQAQINEIKSLTSENHVRSGALSPEDVRNHLIDDEKSGFSGVEEFEFENLLENISKVTEAGVKPPNKL